ncbi:hypothetical protein GGI17_002735 [Coemansia sp. S146]|nr:hypothetical protein GGI17_002735 [Coemansia sp. S146]
MENAMANAQWASDSFSQVQAAYNQAKSIYTTELTAYNTKAAAYYAQRNLIYCASSIETLARQADLPKAGLELVLKPISLVTIPESAAPSLHEASHDSMRLQVDYDQYSLVAARCFQRDMLSSYHGLRELWVEIGQEYIVQYGIGSRNMPTSKAAVDYFIAEMEPRVRAILQASQPHAQFRVISDLESDRAHLFLMVDVPNQAGYRVCCSAAVMLTMPYLFIAERDNVSTSNACPDWVVNSELPSEEYGRKILTQVYGYLKDGSTVSPPQVCGAVAQHVAIWSTYNDTWIVHNMGTCDSAATPPPDMHTAGAENMLTISTRFSVTNADPHIAFVYAKVLDDLIRDMQNSTEDDSSVPEVQGNTNFIVTMPAAALPDHNLE